MSWQRMRLVALRRAGWDAAATVEQELAGERAHALGRIGRRLEEAVARWRRLAGVHPADHDAVRRALSEVSEATWMLLVQRECTGLRADTAWVREHYDVPREALERMGARDDVPDPDHRPRAGRGDAGHGGVPWWDEQQRGRDGRGGPG